MLGYHDVKLIHGKDGLNTVVVISSTDEEAHGLLMKELELWFLNVGLRGSR